MTERPQAAQGARAFPPRWIARIVGGLSARLYWRTFFLIALLVSVSVAAWYQSFRTLQRDPLATHAAHDIASTIDLARLSLADASPARREALFAHLAERHEAYVFLRHPTDVATPIGDDEFMRTLRRAAQRSESIPLDFAASVNGARGIWIGFNIGKTPYWLRFDPERFSDTGSEGWLIGSLLATVVALLGAAVIAGLVNRPLRDLARAIAGVRAGDFSYQLDENAGTEEIRAVNRGFNRMARSLHALEQDRALMLAGISHDIRTPLARLRLEAELSVPDPCARRDIVSDIEQADAIISKFMEYASRAIPARESVDLADLVAKVISDYAKVPDLRITFLGEPEGRVLGDPLELHRVLVNLLENARRYGSTPGGGGADVDISLARRGSEVVLAVRDHGLGVPAEQLPLLTRPFFRGERARPADRGSGLGLAIVEKSLDRMGGRLVVSNAKDGGLLLRLWLMRDPLDALPPPQL